MRLGFALEESTRRMVHDQDPSVLFEARWKRIILGVVRELITGDELTVSRRGAYRR